MDLLPAENQRKLEILYRGHYYDVTNFIPHHPGGEQLIRFYTNPGEDASEAIEQFHFRSEKRVQAILNSFSKRKATEEELISNLGNNKAKYQKNLELTRDFALLFQELKDEGLFEPSMSHVFLRWMEIILVSCLGWYLFVDCGYMLGTVLMCVGSIRAGWFIHEGGHFSLTGKPWVDRLIEGQVYGFYCGLSGSSWRDHHNQHHAMPQHIKNDVDMDTLPIIAFHDKVVKDKGQFGFLVKYQKWLIYLVQTNIIGFWYKYVLDPWFCWKHGCYWDLFWMLVNNLVFLPILGVKWYWAMGFVTVTFCFINSTLSHTHMPVVDEEPGTHWVEYALLYTANVTPSRWMNYMTGYLNYQVEHHLFPTMPQFRNQLATERVKALAKKHGLPYHVYGWWEILGMTLNNLGKVSEKVEEKFQGEVDAKKKENERSPVSSKIDSVWKFF